MLQLLVYVREKYRNYPSLFGEGGARVFSWRRDRPFLVSVNRDIPKTVLWIVIVVHFVKHELPKFSIVYTYIKDQLKKINSKFGQTT